MPSTNRTTSGHHLLVHPTGSVNPLILLEVWIVAAVTYLLHSEPTHYLERAHNLLYVRYLACARGEANLLALALYPHHLLLHGSCIAMLWLFLLLY